MNMTLRNGSIFLDPISLDQESNNHEINRDIHISIQSESQEDSYHESENHEDDDHVIDRGIHVSIQSESQEDFEQSLRQLLNWLLEGVLNIDNLIFIGGGDFKIPGWFISALQELGIRIFIINPGGSMSLLTIQDKAFRMNINVLIAVIEAALQHAPVKFEQLSGITSWHMPESFIVSSLMTAIGEVGLLGVPEVPIKNNRLSYFVSGGKQLNQGGIPNGMTGREKIDLFIGEKLTTTGRIPLRAILEIKGSQSNWPAFVKDIDRLKKLSTLLRDKDQFAMFAYVTAPLTTTEQGNDFNAFINATGLKASQVKILPPSVSQGVRRVYVYTVMVYRCPNADPDIVKPI